MSRGYLGLTGLALIAVVVILQCGSAPLDTLPPVEREWVTGTLRDYEFADGRIFDLGRPGDLQPGDSVINLYIYEQSSAQNDLEASFAMMVVDPEKPDDYPGERVVGIRARQLDPDKSKYEVIHDPDKIPYVVFTSSGIRNRALGMWMQVIKKGRTDTVNVGNIVSDTMVLKLLRPTTPNPSHQTWQMMWRNCYDVGRDRTLNEDFNVSVWRGLPGREDSTDAIHTQEDTTTGNNQAYIEILGLDQYNLAGNRLPDGRVDELFSLYWPAWGLLIFPHRTPFDTDTTFIDSVGRATQQLQNKTPEIYNRSYRDADRYSTSKYFIRINMLVP
jgi:hypothetical protein